MGFGSETANKGTTTSLVPSLSKDETLHFFSKNKSVHNKLQELLQDDDRIRFHSGPKISHTFKIFMMTCFGIFSFSLLAGFCFLLVSLLVNGDPFNGKYIFIVYFSSIVVALASTFVVPFRNSVVLTQNSLIVINSMILLPNKVMKFGDISKISKIVASTKVKVAPGQPEVTSENINSLVCEESILKKDGVFEVTLGPQTARFSVNGAEDLIEAFTSIYDTSPTLRVISERKEYLKATVFLAACGVFFFGSAFGALWFTHNYDPLSSVALSGCVGALFVVYFLCFALFQGRKYQLDHTFNPN